LFVLRSRFSKTPSLRSLTYLCPDALSRVARACGSRWTHIGAGSIHPTVMAHELTAFFPSYLPIFLSSYLPTLPLLKAMLL